MLYFYAGRLNVKKNANYECICAFCEHASEIYDEDTMICKTRGVVSKAYSCRKFIYDPLKRIPPKSIPAPKLDFIDID